MLDNNIISAFSDNVIFKELFETIKSNGSAEFSFNYLYSIVKCILYVIFILFVKYFVSDPTRIKTILYDIYQYISNVLCTERKFELKDVVFITKYLFKITKHKNKIIINNLFVETTKKNIVLPSWFYIEIETTMDTTIIKYNILYSRMINKLVKELPNFKRMSEKKWSDKSEVEVITKCFTMNNGSGLKFDIFHPQNMCETKWYKRLNESIETHIKICDKQDYFSSLAILINGRPGLGKTKFIDFLARKKLCNSVTRIDMTRITSYPFTEIIKKYRNEGTIFEKNKRSNILLIDELDKYIDMNVKLNYQKLTSSKKKDEEIIKFEDFLRNQKEEILYEILRLIDDENHYHKNIFIFCANNFDTLFKDIDNTHFHSLKKRFLSFEFEMCEKDEIISYVKHMSNYIELDTKMIDNIPDVKIPYRDLYQLFFISQYKMSIFIEELKKFRLDEVGISEFKFKPTKRSFFREVLNILDGAVDATGNKIVCNITHILSNPLISADELFFIIDEIKDGKFNNISKYHYVNSVLRNPNLNDDIFEKIIDTKSIYLGIDQDNMYLENISLEVLRKYRFEIPASHPSISYEDILNGNAVFHKNMFHKLLSKYSIDQCIKIGVSQNDCDCHHPNAEKNTKCYNKNLEYSPDELEELVKNRVMNWYSVFQGKNFEPIFKKYLENPKALGFTHSEFLWFLIQNDNVDYSDVKKFVNDFGECFNIFDSSQSISEKFIDIIPKYWYFLKNPTLSMLESGKSNYFSNDVFAKLVY